MNSNEKIMGGGSERRSRRVLRWTGRVILAAVTGALALELALRALVPSCALHVPVDRSLRLYRANANRRHLYSSDATNVLRLTVVGDSMIMGVGDQPCSRFTLLLEYLLNLNSNAAPVRVNVYAQPSNSAQQVCLVRQALEHDAKWVLLVVCLNDTEDFQTDGDRLLAVRPDMKAYPMPAWIRPLRRHSVLVRLVYERLDTGRRLRGYRRYYEHIYRDDYPGLAKFRAAIPEMQALCHEKNAQLVGLLFPLLNQDLRPGRYPFLRQHALVAETFRKAGVPLLDLYDTFKESDGFRLQNVPMFDPHPNEIANALAAGETVNFLATNRLMEAARPPPDLRNHDYNTRVLQKVESARPRADE